MAWGIVGWVVGIVFFFPVLWMVLTGFKTEAQAYTNTPTVIFTPTLDAVQDGVRQRHLAVRGQLGVRHDRVHDPGPAAGHAVRVRAVAAAGQKTRDVLFFFISTKMLPIVAAIIPIYIAARNLHMLDNIFTLVILYTAMNLPIAVWMMRSFFLEVPSELLEAAEMDGAPCARP